MKRRILFVALILFAAAAAGYYALTTRASTLVLTGIVTTNDVVVSSQVGGQLSRVAVKEGDVVRRDQVVAVIAQDELRAERAYYASAADGATSQVLQSAAALRLEEQQTQNQIRQAEASFASAQAQQASAQADLVNARTTFERDQQMLKAGVTSQQEVDQARAAFDGLKARVESLGKQADAAAAAVALAKSNAEQVAVRRNQLHASEHELAAASAQREKASVRLGYTEIHAPIDAVVDTAAARQGEVITSGQPIVTLINPDDLWVRFDVEETYIDRVRLGDCLTVRLPSGAQLTGTVSYRAVDAGFATQRDVSRTKRDIKTFEVRLRVDNHDRRLAVGMTTYVLLPVSH